MTNTPGSLSSLSSVILAGGRSRRMGQDKALMALPNGKSLLGQTVEVARSLTDQINIVTPWPERYQSAIAPPILWIKDPLEAGPLTGFAQAWPQIQSDWCLLLACDLPHLDARKLNQWWQWLSSKTDKPHQLQASLVKSLKGWEPLCGYYHRSCLPSLTQHLHSGELDFQSWLPTLKILTYQDLPPKLLFNCNRPSDWAELSPTEKPPEKPAERCCEL